MNGPTLRQTMLVTNPQGLRIRPATKFAECVQKSQCEVFVSKDEQRVDGRHPWQLFLLLALQGTELTIEATGPDAESVIPALIDIINTPYPEDV